MIFIEIKSFVEMGDNCKSDHFTEPSWSVIAITFPNINIKLGELPLASRPPKLSANTVTRILDGRIDFWSLEAVLEEN